MRDLAEALVAEAEIQGFAVLAFLEHGHISLDVATIAAKMVRLLRLLLLLIRWRHLQNTGLQTLIIELCLATEQVIEATGIRLVFQLRVGRIGNYLIEVRLAHNLLRALAHGKLLWRCRLLHSALFVVFDDRGKLVEVLVAKSSLHILNVLFDVELSLWILEGRIRDVLKLCHIAAYDVPDLIIDPLQLVLVVFLVFKRCVLFADEYFGVACDGHVLGHREYLLTQSEQFLLLILFLLFLLFPVICNFLRVVFGRLVLVEFC